MFNKLKAFKKSRATDAPSSSTNNLTNFYATGGQSYPSSEAPPEWAPALENSHKYGKLDDAPAEEYRNALEFCKKYPLDYPKMLPSDTVDEINRIGCKAWGIEVPITPRFVGHIENYNPDSKGKPAVVSVRTQSKCKDVCLLSTIPIVAGLYDFGRKKGMYYEVYIKKMKGIIAIGTACKPYPQWRLPGWDRMSAGLHLDDMRKFFEDPNGGREYAQGLITRISPGDTVGCGYELQTGAIFYTYNGTRLPNAFTGIYLPHNDQDVFAAIGVEGDCEFEVNFGGELFRWLEGNEWDWRVEGHVGRLEGRSGHLDDELPSYQEARSNLF
ncbi:endosome protein [Agrocybe pediades]|nr:endosome protein [Agrocybe pediades]